MTVIYFSVVQQTLAGQGLPIIEPSRPHSDTPQSVGLLWMSDQPVTENSTSQHSQETNIISQSGIRTRNPSKAAAVYPLLRPRGHYDRQ
jgi:hypothetical protein